jgi:hypothetical protein
MTFTRQNNLKILLNNILHKHHINGMATADTSQPQIQTPMNTSLKTISLAFAVGLFFALSAELCGATLPAVVESGQIFTGFVIGMVFLTLSSDYSRPSRALSSAAVKTTACAPVTPLLVQLEDKRLAA